MSRARRVVVPVVVSLFGAVLLLELGIRLYFFGLHASPKELLVASANETLVYELAPGVESTYTYLNPHQRRWEYSVRVGEDGFRRVPAAPGPEPVRILVLGDSYAFGFGVDDDETFAARLAVRLGGRAEVRNWGVPGYNLAQQAELLRARGEEASPDVVVLALHPNDFEPVVFDEPGEVTWVRASHVYALVKHLRYVGSDVEADLERTRGERIREGRAAFEDLLGLRERRGFELVLFKVSCWSGVDDPEVARLFHDARRRGVVVVDLDAAFCREFEALTIPDDGHPTAEGHDRLAERLQPTLERLVAGASKRPEGARSEP